MPTLEQVKNAGCARIGERARPHSQRRWMRPKAQRCLVAVTIVGLAGLLLPDVRHWLERDMARHMLVEFPLLMFVGYGFATAFASASSAVLSRFDQLGVASLTLATATLTVWMIPAALDATLADPSTAMTKYTTLVATGFAVHGVIVGPRWRCSRSSSWASRG